MTSTTTLLFDGDRIENGLVFREGVDYSIEAILMDKEWLVRPKNVSGVSGYYYGRTWRAIGVVAPSAEVALRKVGHLVWVKDRR